MRFSHLPSQMQIGLRFWAHAHFGPAWSVESIDDVPAAWAWIYFLLRAAEDRPDWFPSGKRETLRVLETRLLEAARQELPERDVCQCRLN